MVELPERFIVCDQAREIAAEFGISRGKGGLHLAGENRFVFFRQAGEISLEAIVKVEGGAAGAESDANEVSRRDSRSPRGNLALICSVAP